MPSDTAPAQPASKPEKKQDQKKGKPIRYPFWFGGSASSMAACVTHPLDLGESELIQNAIGGSLTNYASSQGKGLP